MRRALLIGMALLLGAAGGKTKARFPDPGLEAAVRMAVGKAKGDIYLQDLAELADLVTNAQKIKSLQGLEQCPALTYLHIGYNEVSDLAPVAALAKLEELVASNNKITDLTPLAGLTSLRKLNLDNNQISDLAPLVTLLAAGGLGKDAVVSVKGNPLSPEALAQQVPALEAGGVKVKK